MTDSIQSLIRILQDEYDIYVTLLEVAEEKKEVIIENRVKELEKITLMEQSLSSSLVKLENMRSDVIEDILAEEGIVGVNTISELANRLDPMSRELLNREKTNLLTSIGELRAINNLNGDLIDQSLRFIDLNLSLIGDGDDGSYSKHLDDYKVLRKKNIFDAKV